MVKEEGIKYEKVSMPKDAAEISRNVIGDTDRELILVLCLDAKSQINAVNVAGIGSLNSAVVHPREIFKPAILGNADKIIFVHNHPTGDTTPGEEDRKATAMLKKAGEVLNIPLIDSLIIGDNGTYYSFANEKEL
jgi:DNA repair proteins